jgi:hypothetical protein
VIKIKKNHLAIESMREKKAEQLIFRNLIVLSFFDEQKNNFRFFDEMKILIRIVLMVRWMEDFKELNENRKLHFDIYR